MKYVLMLVLELIILNDLVIFFISVQLFQKKIVSKMVNGKSAHRKKALRRIFVVCRKRQGTIFRDIMGLEVFKCVGAFSFPLSI